MSKLLLSLSFISLIILILGTSLAHNNGVFILASSTNVYQYVREFLAAILLGQILTHPPRRIVFRLLSGVVALGVAVWTGREFLGGTLPLLDLFALSASAIAIGITALEFSSERSRSSSAKINNSANPLIA